MPITAGREKSIKLLQEAHKQGKLIAVVSQKNASEEEPTPSSLNTIGTLGKILKIINLPEGNITAIIKGVDRCKSKKMLTEEPYFTTEITRLKDTEVKKESRNLLL